ncbi:hypothetical protein GCM10009744_26820 [Kribbella alba]|uniref:DUF5666 domain-containing protein n=1 Tax=Kribbella alba TaxID=190197 RepID=A0ABN2FB26_9ACTN
MRRVAAAVPVLVLALASGCGGGNDKTNSAPPPATCTGTDTPGTTHVLQSGPVTLPGGGRAVLNSAHLDATPPTAELSLLGVDPAERTAAEVKVGDAVTVKAKKYAVMQICTDHVQLQAQ